MKVLILSDFAAPYRIEVFRGISTKFDCDVFFNCATNDSRNSEWYIKSSKDFHFEILDKENAIDHYNDCIKQIKEYDVVLCYDPWHKRSRALQRLCMRKKIPCILNADGALGITTSFPKKQIKTYYTKRATLCFAGCDRAVEYFKAYGASDEKIVKHPFTSLKKEQLLLEPYSLEQKSELKRELGIEDKPMFVAVGQFITRKGFDILLDAWGKANPQAQLYIIGGGPLEEQYLQFIKENSLNDVHIIGFKKPDELRRYYLASDVFVMPTREDIWGLVVNEAMAVGLPVITSDHCTSGNELVVNGENGYIYKCEDTDKLAEYIKMLADDEALRQNFSKASLSKIQAYTLENIIESHIESILKVTGNKK